MTAGQPHAASILRSRADLESLESEWSELRAGRLNPLLGHRWCAAAAATLHAEAELRIIAIRRAGLLAGVAPMAAARDSFVTWLELVGTRVLYEPAGILAADPAALEALCQALVAQRRPLALQRIEADDSLTGAMQDASRGRGIVLLIRSPPCQRVDLHGSWDEYMGARSAGLRSGLRRKRRMLESQGSVSFDRLRPAPGELDDVLAEVSEVEADGWKGVAGSAIRQNEKVRRFLGELAARSAAGSTLQVSFLRVGSVAVATNLLLEHDNRLWELKTGYRDAWSRASPGQLLLWETLQDAHARGLAAYEFLGSGDGRQPSFATASRRLQTIVYFPWNVSGILAFAGVALRRLASGFR